jgi:hypothetical protein
MLIIYPHLYLRMLRCDALVDFQPVTPVCSFPFALAARADHSAKTLQEFVVWAKGQSGALAFASPAASSMPRSLGTQMAKALGLQLTHVPYRGTAPALQDLIAGQIPMVLVLLGEVTELHKTGQVRILATIPDGGARQRLVARLDLAAAAHPGLPLGQRAARHPLHPPREPPAGTADPYVHIGLIPHQAGCDIFETNLGTSMLGPETRGERIRVEGRILDGTGAPVRDVLIEVWQANAAGRIIEQPERRQTLIARRELRDGRPAHIFHISLQGEGETVFFDI